MNAMYFKKYFLKSNLLACQLDWVLVGILAIGGIARGWGLNFGLPHPDSYPDQSLSVHLALGYFSGDFNPRIFSYPSFYQYVLFFAYCCYFLLGKLTGRFATIPDLIEESVIDPTNFYLIARGISVVLGTATIFLVYTITKSFFDRKVALVASLFLSLAFLHVRDSHFGLTDIPMIFLLLISLLFTVKSDRDPSLKNYAISGIFAGLATSTKYNALLSVVPMSIVHFFNILSQRQKQLKTKKFQLSPRLLNVLLYGVAAFGIILIVVGIFSEQIFTSIINNSQLASVQPEALERAKRVLKAGRSLAIAMGTGSLLISILFSKVALLKRFLDKRIAIFAALFFGFFFVGTPFALVEFLTFAYGFLVESVVNMGGKGINLGIGWLYHFKFTLPFGLGWALFVAALIGIIILIKLNPKNAAILLSFPFVYYFLAGKSYSVYVRYMTPIVPFACIAAAICVVWISKRLSKAFSARISQTAIAIFLTTLIVLQSAYSVVQFNWLLTQKDNRLIAAEWVLENLPNNSSYYQTGAFWGHLDLYPLSRLEQRYQESVAKGRTALAQLLKSRIEYLQKTNVKGLQEWEYDLGAGYFKFNNQQPNGLPDYIIRQEYPVIVTGSSLPEKLEGILKSHYRLNKSFVAIDINNRENKFDQADAFYIPFAGFKNIERPGPNIFVYEKINN
jgi:Dolichyl-phosphate-mannose-protein mannosyltransferase